MYSPNAAHKSMPAIPIPRHELQTRPQIIKLLVSDTIIMKLYEINLINDIDSLNMQTVIGVGVGEINGLPSLGLTLRMGV
jgi:hypothetical protein